MSYPLLQKPIYAYSIPQQLLDILSVRSVAPIPEPEPIQQEKAQPPAAPVPGGALSCQTCGNVVFSSVDEQRRHFRSDWHRFNVAGKGGVTEEAFEAMDGESSGSWIWDQRLPRWNDR
jgi:hypothetical protein